MKKPQYQVSPPAILRRSGPHRDEMPGWAEGIRSLYDAVIREPLPADFQKLIDDLAKKSLH